MEFLIFVVTFIYFFSNNVSGKSSSFYDYYSPQWGSKHILVSPQGTEVQLLLNKEMGGAGFRSKLSYQSGLFHIRMKIPEKKTGGIIPNIFLTSYNGDGKPGNHFELDFEFIGTGGLIQTNVFDGDGGGREQRSTLWFDPSKDFHDYQILWNYRHIVFMVDNIPIREFKNNGEHGIKYPNIPMHIESSIWAGDWAGKTDWSLAPFISHYRDFNIDGCAAASGRELCDSTKHFWNVGAHVELSGEQISVLKKYKKSHMTYDYCLQKSTWKPECSINP